MNTTQDAVRAALVAACRQTGDHYFRPPEGFKVAEEGEWVQDYKYQASTDIVRHEATGRCFEVYQSRSGSYHTDWYYSTPELGDEVKLVTKTVTVERWEAV